jgi:hypothetical protein
MLHHVAYNPLTVRPDLSGENNQPLLVGGSDIEPLDCDFERGLSVLGGDFADWLSSRSKPDHFPLMFTLTLTLSHGINICVPQRLPSRLNVPPFLPALVNRR